jgi:hypothetical protein
MANYVKFMRGSLAAYNKLVTNNRTDDDTLYFLSGTDGEEGYLYLGTKLISGPENLNSEDFTLAKLKDVVINENLNYDALLMYDHDTGKWHDYDFESLVFRGATDENDGLAGLVPAPSIKEKNLFLRGDGSWAAAGTVE